MNSLNIPTFGASTSINLTIDQTSIDNVRNHLFPHAICAIAGLLYWFAREADLLPTPLTYAYVSGTYELYQGGTGNWYVQQNAVCAIIISPSLETILIIVRVALFSSIVHSNFYTAHQ